MSSDNECRPYFQDLSLTEEGETKDDENPEEVDNEEEEHDLTIENLRNKKVKSKSSKILEAELKDIVNQVDDSKLYTRSGKISVSYLRKFLKPGTSSQFSTTILRSTAQALMNRSFI